MSHYLRRGQALLELAMADFLSSSLRRDCFLLVAAIIDGHPKNQLLLASLSIVPVGGTSSLTALFRPLPTAAAVGADKFSAARLAHALLPAAPPPAANSPACFRCERPCVFDCPGFVPTKHECP